MSKKKLIPTPLHYHEALDRTSIIFEMIGDFLVDHPVYETEEEYRDLVKNASKDLWDAYQMVTHALHARYGGSGLAGQKKVKKNRGRTGA